MITYETPEPAPGRAEASPFYPAHTADPAARILAALGRLRSDGGLLWSRLSRIVPGTVPAPGLTPITVLARTHGMLNG